MLNRISGGLFRDFEGTPLSSGYLIMELSHDEQDTAALAQVVSGLKIRVPLDNNGSIAGVVNVEVNSTLLPANSYYIVNAYRNDGTKAWKAAQFVQVPASPTPYNVGNWIPTNPPGSGFGGGGGGGVSISLQTNGTPNSVQTIENLIAGTNVTLVADSGGGTTISATGGSSILLETNGVENGSQSTLNLIAGSNITLTDGGTGGVTIASTASGSGLVGYLGLENGTPDQTGNSFYSVLSLTNWLVGHWEFVTGQASFVVFSMRLPATVPSNADVILEIFSGDSTVGHTATFQISDAVVNTGTMNVGSLTAGFAQTYTTTATAYQRVTQTYLVQSSLVANGILIIKVATSTTGTAPSTNMYVLPYLKLIP